MESLMAHRSHVSDVRGHGGLRADLEEALQALEFVGRALEQSIGDGLATGTQQSALAVVERVRRKYKRDAHSRIDAAA